jgi:hypothetical protein
MTPETHVFAHVTGDGELYHREVRLETDGSLLIIGHDLGETEYEFERRVPPDGVRQLMASSGVAAGAHPLEALRDAFSSTVEIERRIEELGIATEFWNRIG